MHNASTIILESILEIDENCHLTVNQSKGSHSQSDNVEEGLKEKIVVVAITSSSVIETRVFP